MNLKSKVIKIENVVIRNNMTVEEFENIFEGMVSVMRFEGGGVVFTFDEPCELNGIDFEVTVVFNRYKKLREIKLTPVLDEKTDPIEDMKLSFAIMKKWLELQLGEPDKYRENFEYYPYCGRIEYSNAKVKGEVHQEPVSGDVESAIIRITMI